jgi:hypothetical protein
MNIYYLDNHDEFCPCNQKECDRFHEPVEENDFFDSSYFYRLKYICEKNPEYFLFQLDRDFHLIIYYRCISGTNESDFFTSLIKKSIEGTKGKKYANVKKSIPLNDWLNQIKKGDFDIKNYFEEVIHIYDGSFKVPNYCITRRLDFFDVTFLNDDLKKNYIKAKEKLIEKNLDFLLNDLNELYHVNYINSSYVSDKEVVKTIDSLIKQINKLANGK